MSSARRGRLLVAVALFFFAVALVAGYPIKLRTLELGDGGILVRPGGQPPDFELASIDGEQVRLFQVLEASPVVVLTFWATWCRPCISELRDLAGSYPETSEHGFAVVAVNVGESPEAVRGFQSKENLPFELLVDQDGAIAGRYGVKAFPTSVLIVNRVVSQIHVGADPYLSSDIRRALRLSR
jgi:peroxiredoxin